MARWRSLAADAVILGLIALDITFAAAYYGTILLYATLRDRWSR